MKTSELSGFKLDYWVARARGLMPERLQIDASGVRYITEQGFSRHLCYSTDWRQGGEILPSGVVHHRAVGGQHSFAFVDGDVSGEGEGPSLLIAAMRAIVFSVYGDHVPDEVR